MSDKVQEPTIFAAFRKSTDAEAAITDLINAGIRPEKISLIMSEKRDDYVAPTQEELDNTIAHKVATTNTGLGTPDPLGNKLHDTPLAAIRSENGLSLEEGPDLNPAQNDYPMTTTGSSAPADAHRDYNPGLEKDYNRNYNRDVEKEIDAEATTEKEARDRAGDKGVETPVIADAADTVKRSAMIGVGAGALAAIATLALPGIGIILGGGALAAAAATMATGAADRAAAGGVAIYLTDQGVPGDDIPVFRNTVENGGALVAVHTEEEPVRVSVEKIFNQHHPSKTSSYGYAV